MDKAIEFVCAKHLDEVLVGKVHSESPLVISIEPCEKCFEEIDEEVVKEKMLEMIKEELS